MPTKILRTTSNTRPISPAVGEMYFETDTKNFIIWDGANWIGYQNDGVSIPELSNSFSASFNGSSDYLNVGQISTLAGATAQTVSFWFKSSTAGVFPAWGFRVHSQNQFDGRQVGTTGSADYWFEARNGSGEVDEFRYVIANSDMPSDTNWHHFAFTFDAGSPAVYIDAVQKIGTPTKTAPSSLNLTTGNFSIGRLGDTTTLYSEGSFDEFGMWDAALNSSNIEQLYNLGKPFDLSADTGNYNKSTDLKQWWRMGDSSGDTSSGGGAVVAGNTIGTVVNKVTSGTNDALVGGGAPTYNSSTPTNP